MTRKFKLGLAGASFLGVNGAVVPAIDSNFNLFDSLKVSGWRGGHFSQRTDFANRNHEPLKLSFDDNKSQDLKIDFSDSNLQAPALKLNKPEDILSSIIKTLTADEGSTSAGIVRDIYSEIDLEGRVQEVERNTERLYQGTVTSDETFDDRLDHYRDRNIEEKIKSAYEKITKQGKNDLFIFDQSDRKILMNVYRLTKKLKKRVVELLQQLQKEISGEKQHSTLLQEITKVLEGQKLPSQDILDALAAIDWHGLKIKTEGGWKKWSENPYRFFYGDNGESEFKKLLDQGQKQKQNAESQISLLNRSNRAKDYQAQWFKQRIQQLQAKKSNSNHLIILRVAVELLKWMERIK